MLNTIIIVFKKGISSKLNESLKPISIETRPLEFFSLTRITHDYIKDNIIWARKYIGVVDNYKEIINNIEGVVSWKDLKNEYSN